MKITYAAAVSRDGFIAREDGDVSWLDEMNIDPSETGLQEFVAGIDGLIMGRDTYKFVLDYGSWPYGNKRTWVCTHREIPGMKGANLVFVEEKVFSKYEAKVKKGTELVQQMRVVSVDEPSEALAKKI